MSDSRKRPAPAPALPPKKRARRFPWWTLPVIVLCACLLFAAWVFADEQLTAYEKFSQMRDTVAGDTFHGPVYLNGIALEGLTMDEARRLVTTEQEDRAGAFELYIASGDMRWRVTQEEVPMAWNTDEQLNKLYMVGRVGTLEARASQIQNMLPLRLTSEFTYDKTAIRPLTNEVAALLTRPAEDASVVAFDVVNRRFAFQSETVGQTVDSEELYQSIINHLDAGQYGATVQVNVIPVLPRVTRAELTANYGRITSFTTKTTSDKNRNTNISLAAAALNGVMIASGGEISFNQTTGQRTTAKGYKEAGAIENGRTVQEVGGGVCQVSSTMFNALVRANCEIVKRKPHAWPSDYVPRGEDATVDWPNLDVVLRNASDAPMFLTAWYENQTVTVEVYGLSLGEGVSVDLESETTYTNKPTEVVNTYNASLPVGTRQLLKKARTGYSVTTYKIWLLNGSETRREKFYTSEYKTIYEEYEYNDGKPPTGL